MEGYLPVGPRAAWFGAGGVRGGGSQDVMCLGFGRELSFLI